MDLFCKSGSVFLEDTGILELFFIPVHLFVRSFKDRVDVGIFAAPVFFNAHGNDRQSVIITAVVLKRELAYLLAKLLSVFIIFTCKQGGKLITADSVDR